MKYKGFLIEPHYLIDYKQNRVTGEYITVKKDIDFFEIFDPIDGGKRFCAENTIKECKMTIDALLMKLGLNDNNPDTWAKLDQ